MSDKKKKYPKSKGGNKLRATAKKVRSQSTGGRMDAFKTKEARDRMAKELETKAYKADSIAYTGRKRKTLTRKPKK